MPHFLKTHSQSVKTESQKLIKAAECEILFLPPYSPDMNPIEKYWANMKIKVRELLPKSQALDMAILSCEFNRLYREERIKNQ